MLASAQWLNVIRLSPNWLEEIERETRGLIRSQLSDRHANINKPRGEEAVLSHDHPMARERNHNETPSFVPRPGLGGACNRSVDASRPLSSGAVLETRRACFMYPLLSSHGSMDPSHIKRARHKSPAHTCSLSPAALTDDLLEHSNICLCLAREEMGPITSLGKSFLLQDTSLAYCDSINL